VFSELTTDFKKGAFTALGVVAVILLLSLVMKR
jgi:hypothetical protein